MRELFLVRHAKSSWDDPLLADFDRPLNERGKRDAPRMGEHLAGMGVRPDLIVASPAKRAGKTAKIVAEKLGYDPKNIRWVEGIYEASVQSLLYLICSLPDEARRVMVVGHNPGLTHLADILGDMPIDNIPTAGAVGLVFDAKSWDEACRSKGHTLFFEYPKKLKKG